ncbi:MAG: hypothetical protein JWP63_5458 [Candidatus Solibacter sp.]|jgi:hypothetical protein|nr:hypothetical protein [Candidatus Solibacter sp.]
MNTLILPLALLCGLVLCATGVSVFVAFRAHGLLAEIDSRAQLAKGRKDEQPSEPDPLRATVDTLAAQLRDLQSHPHVAAQVGAPKAGFNLSKRSQALRMHRRGEAPEQIAATLDLPRQEVELLLKVHRIVIQNV